MNKYDINNFPVTFAQGDTHQQIRVIYEYAIGYSLTSINWYAKKIPNKRRFAILIRFCVILIFTAAALSSFIYQTFPDTFPILEKSSFVSLLVGLGGLLILIDKFWNLSGGWMRFIKTELLLCRHLDEFHTTFQENYHRYAVTELDDDAFSKLVGEIKNFLITSHNIVINETDQWIAEFQSVLTKIDTMQNTADSKSKE